MTDIDAIQAAVQRAAAFQRHADENGFGRPVHPEVAMTDDSRSLVAILADDVASAAKAIKEHPADADYWAGYKAHARHIYERVTGEVWNGDDAGDDRRSDP